MNVIQETLNDIIDAIVGPNEDIVVDSVDTRSCPKSKKRCFITKTNAATIDPWKGRAGHYVCDYDGCGHRCQSLFHFKDHQFIHSGQHFQCDIGDCRAVFMTPMSLELHKLYVKHMATKLDDNCQEVDNNTSNTHESKRISLLTPAVVKTEPIDETIYEVLDEKSDTNHQNMYLNEGKGISDDNNFDPNEVIIADIDVDSVDTRSYPNLRFKRKFKAKKSGHQKKQYVCDYDGCGQRFKWISCLQEHQYIHSDEQFPCDIGDCRAVFKTPRRLKAHKLNAKHLTHKTYIKHLPIKSGDSQEMDMNLSDNKDSIRKSRLQVVVNSQPIYGTVYERLDEKSGISHQNMVLYGDYRQSDDNDLDSKKGIVADVGVHSMGPRSRPKSKQRYQGKFNKYITKNKKSDHKKRQFVCDYDGCGKQFEHVSALHDHQYIHSGQQFPCDIGDCRAVFKTPIRLKTHKRYAKHLPIKSGDSQEVDMSLSDNKDLIRRSRRQVVVNSQPINGTVYERLDKKSDISHQNMDSIEDNGLDSKAGIVTDIGVHSVGQRKCPKSRERFKVTIEGKNSGHRKGRYVCRFTQLPYVCGQRFDSLSALQDHQYVHSGHTFPCDIGDCRAVLKTPMRLKHHKKYAKIHLTTKSGDSQVTQNVDNNYTKVPNFGQHSATISTIEVQDHNTVLWPLATDLLKQ